MRCLLLLVPIAFAGCGPSYSPDTYASTAVQQAAKVERGVVVGVRRVAVSPQGASGAVAGAVASGFFVICDSVVPTYPRRSFLLRGN